MRLGWIAVLLIAAGCTPRVHTVAPYRDDQAAGDALSARAAATCAAHGRVVPPAPFHTDGCSAWPDATWVACCVEHDVAYWCRRHRRRAAGGGPGAAHVRRCRRRRRMGDGDVRGRAGRRVGSPAAAVALGLRLAVARPRAGATDMGGRARLSRARADDFDEEKISRLPSRVPPSIDHPIAAKVWRVIRAFAGAGGTGPTIRCSSCFVQGDAECTRASGHAGLLPDDTMAGRGRSHGCSPRWPGYTDSDRA